MDVISTGASPFERAAAEDRARLLGEACAQLSPKQYLVLVLHYRHELTFSAIGRELCVTQVAATGLHKRALASLLKYLNERGVKEFREL